MKKLVCAILMVLAVYVSPVLAGGYLTDDELRAEARQGLEQILDLWREGRYDELYGVSTGGKQTKEAFTGKLASAPLKPVCCWQKMQNVSVRLVSDSKAVVTAKLGFEGKGGGTSFKTRDFKLTKEDEIWRISRSDLMALAEASRKKSSHHRTYRTAGR